jgi:hypothetical protein
MANSDSGACGYGAQTAKTIAAKAMGNVIIKIAPSFTASSTIVWERTARSIADHEDS